MLRKHPYLIVSLVATLVSVVIWMCIPKEYAASTVISDEYKEIDLAVGMTHMNARLRDILDKQNVGINDIAVYSKYLKSEDMGKALKRVLVPCKGMTLEKYVACKDVEDEILSRIEYNISIKKGTVTVQFVDKNPLVASQMLDSVICQLQNFITERRRQMSNAVLSDLTKKRYSAGVLYHEAEREYSDYMDSHYDMSLEGEKNKAEELEKRKDQAFNDYQDAITQCVRQQMLAQRSYMSFGTVKANVVPVNDDSHLVGLIVFIVSIALLFTKAYFLFCRFKADKRNFDYGSMFSPWAITFGVWIALGVSSFLMGNKLDPIPDVFYKSISVWLIIFFISSFFTYNLLPETKAKTPFVGIDINVGFFNLLFYLALVMTPMYVYQIYKLVTMFDTKDLVMNMRELAVNGEGFGFLNYVMVINQSLLLVVLWRYPRIPLWKLTAVILCCIVFAIANMEKLTFFLVFITVAYVLFERKVVKLHTIAMFLVGLVLLFYVFTLMRLSDDASSQDDTSMIDFLGMYLVSPPVAFGHLRRVISPDFCPETLWTVYSYLSHFIGGITVQHQQFEDFVMVPMPTNVYTIMKPFYRDLGLLGVGYFAMVYGVFSGYVYRKAVNGHPFSTCLYTYMVFVLAMQFFDELVFASLPLFIQRMAILYLLCQKQFKISFLKRNNN